MKTTSAFLALAALSAVALADDPVCPISEKVRGHENTEWSIGYGFHFNDSKQNLPRALLVGDSICNAYQGQVQKLLDGQLNVSYWVSSYCVTSPSYLKLLDVYLSEAEYSVVHFNNGLHSLSTDPAAWERGLRAAFELIRKRQPRAKIIWCSSTPKKDAASTENVKALNARGAKVASELGLAVNDLFAFDDPFDRATNWRDACHHVPALVAKEAEQVASSVRAAMK